MSLWLDFPKNGFRTEIIKYSEKTEDKTRIRERLNEIGNQSPTAYGEFRSNQILISISLGMVPIIAAALLIINLAEGIGLSLFFGIFTYFLYDRYLDSQVKPNINLQVNKRFLHPNLKMKMKTPQSNSRMCL